jgi:hypothetical protein
MSKSRLITAACVLLLAAGAAIAVAAWLAAAPPPALAFPAEQAQKDVVIPSEPQTPVAKPSETQAPAATPSSGGGQRAFIDPATGKLREPEPGEVEALLPAAPRTMRAAVAPKEIAGPGGAIGVAVPEEAMSYSVATLNPDGTVSTECVTGKAKAEALVKSAATAKKTTKKTTKKEEHDHDR